MLVRLILLIVFGGMAFATWRHFYGHRFLRFPLEWRMVASADTRLRRAVSLRKQMAKKLVRSGGSYGEGLLSEVDSVIASMVALVKAADHAAKHGARLDAALRHVVEAHEHVSSVTGDVSGAVEAAADRLDSRTDRLKASLRAYEEASDEAGLEDE
jgi:hypothetical protein